jgi:GntR family transcriptional regulator / MocR family aminotransferase
MGPVAAARQVQPVPIPPEAIRLDTAPSGTLQERIRQVVASAIRDGRFRAGERMPSSRAA